jgi:uncharacterized membrane protein
MKLKPINLILGIVIALLGMAGIALLARFLTGHQNLTHVALYLFGAAVLVSFIPLGASVVYLLFEKVRRKDKK